MLFPHGIKSSMHAMTKRSPRTDSRPQTQTRNKRKKKIFGDKTLCQFPPPVTDRSLRKRTKKIVVKDDGHLPDG